MPFCRSCAKPVPEGAGFCGWCGYPFSGTPVNNQTSTAPAGPTGPVGPDSRSRSGSGPWPPAQPPERTDQREAASKQEQGYRRPFVPPAMQLPPTRPMPAVPGAPQVGHVPMVHGAPPLSHVPGVQGVPQPTSMPPTPAVSQSGSPPGVSHVAGAHGSAPPPATSAASPPHVSNAPGQHTGSTVPRPSSVHNPVASGQHALHGASTASTAGGTIGGTTSTIAIVKVVVIIAIIASATTGTTLAALRLLHPGSTHPHGPVGITTQPMPATLTSCPAVGTGRAMVSRPLATGKDDSLVYIENGKSTAALKRYNAKTGRTVSFYTVANTTIADAQLSADGQWVLFNTAVTTADGHGGKYAALGRMQMIRLDGQGLQTLYCFSNQSAGGSAANQFSGSNVNLSPDRHYVAFQENGSVYILNLHTGQLQKQVPILKHDQYTYTYFEPLGWMDTTHLYLTGIVMAVVDGGNASGLYLLNVSKGPLASAQNLPLLRKTGALFCWDFDENLTRTSLYYSQCPDSQGGYTSGASFIVRQPALGGPESTIYSTTTNLILNVRAINKAVMFFMSKGVPANSSGGPPTSGAANVGWWKINDDGSGLTRLSGDSNQFSPNIFTRSPWASVSRDSRFYLLYSEGIPANYGVPVTPAVLRIASTAGGAPVTIASKVATSSSVSFGWPAGVIPAGWTVA